MDLKKIFCIGGANIDSKLKLVDALILGSSNPTRVSQSFGGVARNVAENLSHLTTHVYLQCLVGKDSEGKLLLAHLQKKGVNIDASLVLDNAKTAQYYAVLSPTGELFTAFSSMDIYQHSVLSEITSHWNWPAESFLFIDTNLPIDILKKALRSAKEKNCFICIDPVSVTKSRKLYCLLDGIYLIKPNLEEASALVGFNINSIKDCEQAGKNLLDQGVKNVVISLGKEGYFLANAEICRHFRTDPIDNIVDVSGAGDAFMAGILAGLQNNLSLIQACKVGAATASYTLTSNDTVVENFLLKNLPYFNNFSKLATG